ncbi:hypothetical protein [Thermococcus sp.]
MEKVTKALILVVFIGLIAGSFVYIKYERIEPVEKPALWGLSDPPSLSNFTWMSEGGTQVLNVTLKKAPEVYGNAIKELKLLGYALDSGNWSSSECQWSLWVKSGRAYYVAYRGSRLLAIRGKFRDVVKATEKKWLCGRPLDSTPVKAPTPEMILLKHALQIGNTLMKHNVEVSPGNWTGPLPDWYLEKMSFTAKVGEGVEILLLLYSSDDQVRYAEYVMRQRDRSLRFLEGDAEDYRILIVLKGRKADVGEVEGMLQGPPVK